MIKHGKLLQIHPADTVAVALEPLYSGEKLAFGDIALTAGADIGAGHKIALEDILPGQNVMKYGHPIGHATVYIPAGSHVHTHNTSTNLDGLLTYEYQPVCAENAVSKCPVFSGYVRSDGSVGIRNEIWIIPTVGCVNKTAEWLAREADKLYAAEGSGIDGVYSFPHPYGCSQMGADHLRTQSCLASLVRHPNAAGVLVLGLGCENNNIDAFKKKLGEYNPQRVLFLNAQDADDEIKTGLELLRGLSEYASAFHRVSVPVSRLKVGLKCGGSDGFSGITANPLVGAFSDILTACGGTTLLGEVPEMFGAETILMNRCTNREVFDKTVRLINNFKTYFMEHNCVIYENPAPGNKAGGITTLEDKSLGCTQKGGTSCVTDVLDYAQPSCKTGLNLLYGPGNDLVACTALAAAGANLILFTTGRGTPYGGPVPTVKISTNSQLAARKPGWIDFDAGRLVEDTDADMLARELFSEVLRIASGEVKTKSENNGYREIAIFKDGVTV